MKARRRAGLPLLLPLLLVVAGCGGRPAEIVPPLGKPEYADASAEHPRLKFADGMLSTNDCCPVTKRKLSVYFPPVYVNGQAIGFC
jgi:hypothetical protein